MTLHMIKLCVGAHQIEDLAEWQKGRMATRKKAGKKALPYHTTFQTPKRVEELLDGGSMYWVMKGIITVRQKLVGFEEGTKDNGSPCCVIVLDPVLVPVRPAPRRAFQGWRYFTADDAPSDLRPGAGDGISAMPPGMRKQLADLFLI
ncbi:MAG: DUF1489 domain-containing protein [Hyphomicrobium sp.]